MVFEKRKNQLEQKQWIEPNERCGCCCLTPNCVQNHRTAECALLWLSFAGCLQGFIVNGLVNVVITTIERRFKLSSLESGFIAGGYDVASFLCLLPVSYFGGCRTKPKFIGVGLIILSIGSTVFALPHFFAEEYVVEKEKVNLCMSMQSNQTQEMGIRLITDLNKFKYVFWFGQILHGAGSSPLYTLGATYLDENVSTSMSSIYIAIFYIGAILGPALGYLIGGQLLTLYENVAIDTSKLGFDINNGAWVGAWWIGFLVAAVLTLFSAVPILLFPKTLPGNRITHVHTLVDNSSNEVPEQPYQTFNASLKVLAANRTFLWLSASAAFDGMLLAGLATFLPKFIQSQYSLTPTMAAMLVGIITIPGAGSGTFVGGYVIKKFEMSCRSIIGFCVFATFSSLVLCFIFVLSCPEVRFVGVTKSLSKTGAIKLVHDCNRGCECSRTIFEPVCSVDNDQFYSACFAGCNKLVEYPNHPYRLYTDCKCINSSREMKDGKTRIQASSSTCTAHCSNLPVFMFLAFSSLFVTFLTSIPSLSATLRTIEAEQKAFALGLQWLIIRMFGTIPSPVIFGAAIDQCCDLWPDQGSSSCAHYNNKKLGTILLFLSIGLKTVSITCLMAAWKTYHPSVLEPITTISTISMPEVEGSKYLKDPEYQKVWNTSSEKYFKSV